MPAQAFQIFDVGKPMRKDPGDHIARLAQAFNATALAFPQRPSVSYAIIANQMWLAKCPFCACSLNSHPIQNKHRVSMFLVIAIEASRPAGYRGAESAQ